MFPDKKIRTFTWKFFELRDISVAKKRVVCVFFSKINKRGATLIRYLRVRTQGHSDNALVISRPLLR